MPKIAKDEFGNKKVRDVLGGRCAVLCYEKDPLLWQYRQKRDGQKSYIYRVLNEPDLGRAAIRAENLYLQMKDEGKPGNATIEQTINEWIRVKEERQQSGQLQSSTVRGAIASLRTAVLLYLTKEKRLKKISDIKNDTFIDYIQWRNTKAWKLIQTAGENKPPKPSTIKRDFVNVHDWFYNYLMPRGYALYCPSLPSVVVRQDQLNANPPIPLETDWKEIYRYFEKWAVEKEGHPNSPRITAYRQMFRHFVLICYNSGCRPKELLGTIEKRRAPHPEGGWMVNDLVKGGLRWCDVEVEPQVHKTVDGKAFEFLEAVLYIQESKTGQPREIPTNTGRYFLRWRRFCDELRKENGLPPLTEKDYVFFNPFTNRPYPYSQVAMSWKQMRTELASVLVGSKSGKPYTLYSLRASYITNQIDEGKDVYLIKKITGHSLEVLNRHYDRSEVRKRRSEATSRTYGAKKEESRKIDLSKLDKYDKDNKNKSVEYTDTVSYHRNSEVVTDNMFQMDKKKKRKEKI